MSRSVTICFDLSADEHRVLQFLAQSEGLSSGGYARNVIKRYLKESEGSEGIGRERRRDFRQQVSIPAVSLVNYSDNVSKSHPVIIKDISKSGVNIIFSEMDIPLRDLLRSAKGFELVFTVPVSGATVALSCKVSRTTFGASVSMAGEFCNATHHEVTALAPIFQ
ncbi:PilZ domain-containing protein [Desulfovibrio mangrovi]|uniref:PilZ domain-containing protein n=1 Tax=Desulfovibrio mangrovi TaxID=2976983 RepID=UPI002246A872|nr:PilZ domain-containing protein [Desulfovibrio mangrovi]UZP67571.1 PilZ domain-containing protein [Desulfovibrio mangrovi]